MRETSKNYAEPITCLLLGAGGLAIIAISSVFQNIVIPKEQQDFSHFLNYNFTWPVGIVFFIVSLCIGYFLKLNPWKVGVCLFAAFPLTAIIEGVLIRGSHNLLPFEFIMYSIYALPSILSVYLGKFLSQQMAKRRMNGTNAI